VDKSGLTIKLPPNKDYKNMMIFNFKQLISTLIVLCLMIAFGGASKTQTSTHPKLRSRINQLAKGSSGRLGVAIKLLESNDTLSYRDDHRYPMQSVFKFPIAFLLLHAVDKGQLKLKDSILLRKSDLHKTVSALFEKYPEGNVKVSIEEVLTLMVTVSDNNACDILMRLLGGPDKLTADLRQIGIEDMAIKGNEFQMYQNWALQYQNWSRPSAQISLLEKLYTGSILSKRSNSLLMDLMLKTYVAPGRIRGGLPLGTPVAHRSGTSGTNKQGLSPATNDVGIITLPDGRHLAIAVFLTDSYDGPGKRDEIIAEIAKAAFEEFNTKL
jgi:beta-lactamase class A